MNILIVDGFKEPSHTFIRSDYKNLGSEWHVIDIRSLSIRHAKLKDIIKNLLQTLKLIILTLPCSFKLIFNRNYKTSLDGYFIATKLIENNRNLLKNSRCIRAHFLSKSAIVSYVISKIIQKEFEVVCHGSDLYNSPRGFDQMLRSANRVECVTYFGKGFVYGRIGKAALHKVVMRRNLLLNDSSVFERTFQSKALRDPDQPLRLVGIGRLVPQKDFEFALGVMAELNALRPNGFRFDVIGNGPLLGELKKSVEMLGIEPIVTFLGALDHDAAMHQLSGADGFLLPCLEASLALADGLPVVFQEAFSLGVPVFCRQAFGVSELIIPGLNGYYFETSASTEFWAKKIVAKIDKFDRKLIASTHPDRVRSKSC